MSIRSALQGKGRKWLLGFLLCIIAGIFLFIAWQTISTDQYVLYRDNVARYEQTAADFRSQSEGAYGSHYAYLAGLWEDLADDAHSYLAQHRSGAACLCIASAVMLAGAMWCFWPSRKPQPAARQQPAASSPSTGI